MRPQPATGKTGSEGLACIVMAAEEAPAPLDGITCAEAAHILDVSPNTVYRLLRSGRLPGGTAAGS